MPAIWFFFKNLASSVTKYHGQLSSCKISEKINDPILRKFRDGRTNRRANKSDFIGRCPTKFERPKDEEYVSNPSCSDPGQREKNNLDIYFHTSLWCLFYEHLYDLLSRRKEKWKQKFRLSFILIPLLEIQGAGRSKNASKLGDQNKMTVLTTFTNATFVPTESLMLKAFHQVW